MTRILNLTFGKVRNGALLANETRILHTTDRLSAFDCILPFEVPGKGEILQALSLHFFKQTSHILKNHIVGALSRNHILVHNAKVFPLEIVVRGFLTGSLWRLYEKGGSAAVAADYGVELPRGLKRNCPLPEPLLTPTTKAAFGHDLPATPKQCLAALTEFFAVHEFELSELEKNGKSAAELAEQTWNTISTKARQLFIAGTQLAAERGLALVDTKYEMGWANGELILIDEIHTPDCSRYWYTSDLAAENPRQLSKEFLREELVASLGNPDSFGPALAFSDAFQDAAFVARLQQQILSRYQEMYAVFVPDKTPFEVCQDSLLPWPVNPKELSALEESLRLPQKILVVGNGGRDYALFKTFESKPEVARVYCAPGNRAWESNKYAECAAQTVDDIARFAADNGVGLVVVGPEAYIAQGITQACKKVGVAVLAPELSGASLEASKVLCKQIINRAKIPTAASEVVSFRELERRIKNTLAGGTLANSGAHDIIVLPRVLKYDCLAAGKGVYVVQTLAQLKEARAGISAQLPSWEKTLRGIAAETYSAQKKEPYFLLEECLEGEEISVLALCNGTDFRLLPFARDYKRRNDGQTGPNTGGMGAVCPVSMSQSLQDQYTITFQRILLEMAKQGTPYRGFLFAGFMIDAAEKAWLIEFNCRLGDPETQVVLPGLSRDFTTELWRTAQGESFLWPERTGHFFEHDGLARVFVVGAAPEYPEADAPRRIFVDAPVGHSSVANTQLVPSAIEPGNVTSGGRAFGILGAGKTISEARAKAYARMAQTSFEAIAHHGNAAVPHYRKDVGAEFKP